MSVTRDNIDIVTVKSVASIIAMVVLIVENGYNALLNVGIPYISTLVTFVVLVISAYQDRDDKIAINSLIAVLFIVALAIMNDKGVREFFPQIYGLTSFVIAEFSLINALYYTIKLGRRS